MTYRWGFMKGHRTYLDVSGKYRRKPVLDRTNTPYSTVLSTDEYAGGRARNK